MLLPKGAARPSIEQIAAGTDGDGKPAVSVGNPEFDPLGGDGNFVVTGAAGDTEYDLYMVVGDTSKDYPLTRCTEVQHMEIVTPRDAAGEKVCEMNGEQYETLADALKESGSVATIKLLKSITNIERVIIEKKDITFDLNGHVLTIHTTADEGLKAIEGTVQLIGEGELNVSGKVYGVHASSGSNITVTNAASWDDTETLTSSSAGVLALSGSKVTVLGNATGSDHGIRAENVFTEVIVEGDVSNKAQIKGAVHCEGQAVVLVKGNVTASRGYGVRTYSGKVTVNKNVSGNLAGAMAEGIDPVIHIKGDLASGNNGAIIMTTSGSIIIDGEIKGTGSKPSPSISYVSIGSTYLAKEDGVPDPVKPGYLKYSTSGAGAVWIKNPLAGSIWEVSNAVELDNALENFKDEDIIKLTANIDYNKGIVIDGKTVTFDVGNYTLNVRSYTPSAGGKGLMVINGGHVKLAGSGQFNIRQIGGNTSMGVQVEAGSSAVVTNIEVTVDSGSAFGAYAYNNGAVIHVLGNIRVSGEGGCGARTWGRGKITVEGTITASAYINIGTTYKDKSSGIDDPEKPGYLKYSTPPNETGIIWVKAEEPVPEYTITVQNDGNGNAYADVNSAVQGTEIALTATANSGYKFKEWQVISGEVTITNNQFTMPAANVIIKATFEAIPLPTYKVIVKNGTGAGNYVKDAVVTITANEALEGQVFDKWISKDGIAFANEYDSTTTFTMPDKDVTVAATYKNIGSSENFRTLTDKPTGISISGKLSEDAQLTVRNLELGDSAACKAIQQKMKDDNYVFILGKNITVTGNYIGALIISVPINTNYNGKAITILHSKQDGTLETEEVIVRNGKAVFETTNPSRFAIFLKQDSKDIPKTGDNFYLWKWMLLCVISAASITLLIFMNKCKKTY